MIRLATLVAGIAAMAGDALAGCNDPGARFGPFYHEDVLFARALAQTADVAPWPAPASGTILPHHLEAAHLIAGGLRQAAGQGHSRVLLMFPDHFFRLERPFATSPQGFETVLGPVPGDPEFAAALAAAGDALIEPSCLFDHDHGIRALLPFIAALMPDIPVVPLAVAVRSHPGEWEAMARHLAPLLGPETLIVQSTDFSHYLPHHEARLRDQQVLNLMAAGDHLGMTRLIQPDHVDSLGSLWLHSVLQQRVHGAAPVVVASENMQEYHPETEIAETTSYVVAHFTDPETPSGPPLDPQARVHVFGGDFFVGRGFTRLLVDDLAADAVARAALSVTQGRPLILNLEGVLLPETPRDPGELVLAMPAGLALDWFERLNVAGVSLANNHAMDVGPTGYAETVAALDAAGIPHAGQGDRLELDGLTVVAMTDISATEQPGSALIGPALLDRTVVDDASRPVLAFPHWGREYDPNPGPREKALAEAMRARGVAAIVGAHPHVASPQPVSLGGGDTILLHSLGNFMFDQSSAMAPTAAVAEIWVFGQGTLFVRRRSLPNLFDIAREALGRENRLQRSDGAAARSQR